jgi:hypothetical protein
MKLTEIILIILLILTCVFGYKLHKHSKRIDAAQYSRDSLKIEIQKTFGKYDSLVSREAVIIEQHKHITNKYYENNYTIITANDSITKNNLFSNLDRYSYLHFVSPSQNNQSHSK